MSGEPRHLSPRDLAYWQSRPQHKSAPGPRPTLGELQREHPWTWLWCERCQHRAPFAFAAAVIRWRSTASSDVLRQRARCTACGPKGATLKHPSWGGNSIGFMPFPVEASLIGPV
jgi:hypothetical protein